MAKNSDIIKIGFDYKSSLEQFAKETNGVFDGISEKAGKQKISIQLDAKNDKVIEKIKELQKLKLDKFTFEFGESGLAEQLKTFDQLEKKISEIINLSKGLSSVVSKTDFGTKNKTEAYNQLKQMADVFKNFYGNDEAMHTKAGTDAAYAYYKAYEEALKKGVAQSKLEKVTVDVDPSDSFFTAEKLVYDRMQQYDNKLHYGGTTDLSIEISSLEERLLKFSNAYSQVKNNLGDAPITSDIIKNIEEYVHNLEIAENRIKDADLMGFDKEDIDIYKDSADMYLGFALEDAIRENEKYKTSLKEVREEKEKTDEVISGVSATASGSIANEIAEQQNQIQEELKETQKIAEQTNESLSKVSTDKSNISSGNIAPIEEKIQDVGNGTKRIISEIGMSYDDFIKKVKSDNPLKERFAILDKYGKVIESLKGDISSLVLPDNMNTSGASKIVHTHPSMNALGGTLSEDDYLQWYSKFISKGIGEQFELLWRGKSLNIDLSNVKEELRSSVISALVNISHIAGLQLEKPDGEIPLPLSDIYNSLSNGLLKNSVEQNGGTVTTEIIDEVKNKVQSIETLIAILDDFGNFRRLNLGNDDAIVKRIEQYKSVLKFLSEHEEYTYEQIQKILANERMTILGTNSQGLTHNGMQLKNDTAEWMSEYLADSYSKINNLSVDSSNFDPFNMSSDAERSYADITCKYYDAIASAMDYVVREALEGKVSENDFVSSAMSSITGEIGSLDDDKILQSFLESKEHVQEYIQSRFDALKTSMDASPMIEVKKDEQSIEEQSKETANAIDEMIAKFSSSEIENMAKALTQCKRGLADFDEMAKSLGVTVDDLYTAQDIFDNKDLFNSLSQASVKENISSENDIAESQNKIQAELKETAEQAEQTAKAVQEVSKTPMKDVIQGDVKESADSFVSSIKNEDKLMEQLADSADKASEAKDKFAESNKKVKQSADASVDAVKEEKISLASMQKEIDRYNKNYKNLNRKPTDANRSTKYQSALDDYKKSIDELQNFYNTLDSSTPITPEQLTQWKDLTAKIDETSDALKAFSAAEKGSTEGGRWKEIDKISKYLDKNTRISKEAKQQLEGYLNLLKSGDPVNIEEIHMKFNQIAEAERIAGNEGKSFLDTIKDKAWYGWAAQIGQMIGLSDIVDVGIQSINIVRELDTALVDLKKTTTMNSNNLAQFYFDANDAAKELGATTQEIIQQASNWSRLGFSDKDSATEMAKLSSQFASISPGMDLDIATDGLVSSMKAFGIEVEDVERKIMDNINRIGNTAATSNEEIVDMLTRSSAAMAVANNTIEETIALETAAVEITRSAETTGTAFKTVSMRIRGYDEETEELSDDLKNITGEIADLTKTASTPGGISLFTDDTKQTYKSTYQILKEISDIWSELSDANQAALLEKLAGKRGGQVVGSLLTNFDAVEKALQEMEGAAGSADAEMGIIEESIEYKINALKETWVGTAQSLVNRDTFGTVVDGLTKISEALGWVVDKAGLLGTIGLGAGLFASFKNAGREKCYPSYRICLQ